MSIRKGLSFSHMGFFVKDIQAMADFYSGVLDFTITDRGHLDTPNGRVELVFTSSGNTCSYSCAMKPAIGVSDDSCQL